jgi:hypothetical protein
MDLFVYGRKIRLKRISADIGNKERKRRYSLFLIALLVENVLWSIRNDGRWSQRLRI